MAVAGNHTTDARLMCAVQGERHTCIGKPRQGGKASPIIVVTNPGMHVAASARYYDGHREVEKRTKDELMELALGWMLYRYERHGEKNIMNRGCARLFLIAALLAGGDVVLAQARTQKIAGDVVRVDGLQLEVKTAAGQAVTVKLADNFRLSVRSAA